MPANPFLRVIKPHMSRVGMMSQSMRKAGKKGMMWMWTKRRGKRRTKNRRSKGRWR
jgi:hypothetical protein